jgi:arsenate reductase (thioredoxin)
VIRTALLLLMMITSEDEAPAKEKVLFLCPYGGAKSVIAMQYFNRIAEERQLPFVAVAAAAEEPYDAVPPKVAAFLEDEGFDVDEFKPRRVAPMEIELASRVVSIGCDLTKLETNGAAIQQWNDVPMVSEDLAGSAAAILEHVKELAKSLE